MRLVGGDGRGHPRLGPEADRREREDLEHAVDGLGREEEGLAQAVVVARAEGEASRRPTSGR